MNRYCRLALGLLLLPGCAAYKELEPDPELSPAERGYIELKDGEDPFELEKDNKYFITFPNPAEDNFYLVLVTPNKPDVHSFLTDDFDTKPPIANETPSDDSISVYAIGTGTRESYFWIIDTVSHDLRLRMRYRYAPQWRYTFENKYQQFRDILANNTVDRTTYNSIGPAFDLERIELSSEAAHVGKSSANIQSMRGELLHLESIFPRNIAASKDTAYLQYVGLRSKVDDEVTFQENYAAILQFFLKEKETRGNTLRFVESARSFADVLSRRDRFPSDVLAKADQVLLARLSEVVPYIDNMIRNKRDIRSVSPIPSVDNVRSLYQTCGRPMPAETETIFRFVLRFNTEAEALQASDKKLEQLRSHFNAGVVSPSETFYADLATHAGEIRSSMPHAEAALIQPYGQYACATLLTREITTTANTVGDLLAMYENAGTAAEAIRARSWLTAEASLRSLEEVGIVSGAGEVAAQRGTLVRQFEEEIFAGVRIASEQRIDAFIKAHAMAVDDVPELYSDSAFLPVYFLTFSSKGPADLTRKRSQINDYLDRIKHVQFPENSIKSIYSELTRNLRERGVEKARAIVEHGRFYKGTDQQVKGLIAECDVEIPKSIVRPRTYRKLFVLPVTDKEQGTNAYMFRIRLNIPSDAQFPVFDVNLKLPEDVADKAAKEQWYTSITIDGKPIKNEGRFRITSPTAENNYETLITPVQMDKGGKNILEIRFEYPGFRVFEVSAMAQTPLIRKN